jgi:hypothetical protein
VYIYADRFAENSAPRELKDDGRFVGSGAGPLMLETDLTAWIFNVMYKRCAARVFCVF